MKNKTFYWTLAIVVIIVIIIAIIVIRNSTNNINTVPTTQVNNSNSNTPVNNNSNNNTNNPTPVNTNTDAYIHGKSVRANPTTGNTTIYKVGTYGLQVYTTVPKGTYIGVADKFDTNKSYISVFIPEAWAFMLVLASQVKIGD